MPIRIHRRRAPGWRAEDHTTSPLGVAYVGRPTRWANPFAITRSGQHHIVRDPDGGIVLTTTSPLSARKTATDWYRAWITGPSQKELLALTPQLLHGRDLMCWCPLPEPGQPDHCHAAVLLKLAKEAP